MQPCGVAPLDRSLGGLEPGLPVVLAGPAGSGRTVLCLELAARALERGGRVAFVTAEPPGMILRQAAALGLDLHDALRDGRLALLELDPGASLAVQAHGADALVAALRAEAGDAWLWILDPITALCREILEEQALHALMRGLLEGLAGERACLVATADAESFEDEPAVLRVLQGVCGAWVSLARHPEGGSTLRVAKSRNAVPDAGELRFRVGPTGSALLEDAPGRPRSRRERPVLLVAAERRDLREELETWLASRWDVVTAEDGVVALSRVLAEQPDAIVLDFHLARIPGREVLHAMRLGGVRVPVLVVVTRAGRASDRVSALVLGASDVVDAPVERFELLHRLEALLRLPAGERALPDYESHLLSPLQARRSRSLPREAFAERLERAARFGEECGVGSTVVLVEAPSEADFDAFVAAADDTLRAEDAVLAVNERCGAVLLVATELRDAPRAFARLAERYQAHADRSDAPLAWAATTAAEAHALAGEEGWKAFRERLTPWAPGVSG